jgi:hypothetical protein
MALNGGRLAAPDHTAEAMLSVEETARSYVDESFGRKLAMLL